ncbi:hypothetical protein DL93DRAFT_2107614, partial [Clavulina sp. PMI_390]
MNELPDHSTSQDIHEYVKHMLKDSDLNLKQEHITLLSEKAQLSFQWASTACRYIVDQSDGNQAVRPSKRLRNMLSNSATADSQTNLFGLYTDVLNAQFGHSKSQDLELLRLLLGVLVAARRPLSLTAVLQLLHVHFSQYGDVEDVKEDAVVYFGLLSSLLTGIRVASASTPLLPLHASFFDFIQDSNSSYYVDVGQAHSVLIESCLAVMLHGERRLQFNICNLSTSFLPNSSVPGLASLIQDKIGEALTYACQFWTSHLAAVQDVPTSTVEIIGTLLSSIQFLHWLEVMSITGVSPLQSLSSIPGQVTSNIAAEVAEAVRFTSYYAIPIAESVPHIYLSALPFIPTSSALHSLYSHFMKMMHVSSGQMHMWPMLRHPLAGHTGWVRSVAFSPDGAVLASGSGDESIRLLWDVQTQSAKGEPLTGHTHYVTSVAFSPDRAVLASGSEDKSIRLWDVQTQAPKGKPMGIVGIVMQSVAFSLDGTILASGASDGSIYLWDITT